MYSSSETAETATRTFSLRLGHAGRADDDPRALALQFPCAAEGADNEAFFRIFSRGGAMLGSMHEYDGCCAIRPGLFQHVAAGTFVIRYASPSCPEARRQCVHDHITASVARGIDIIRLTVHNTSGFTPPRPTDVSYASSVSYADFLPPLRLFVDHSCLYGNRVMDMLKTGFALRGFSFMTGADYQAQRARVMRGLRGCDTIVLYYNVESPTMTGDDAPLAARYNGANVTVLFDALVHAVRRDGGASSIVVRTPRAGTAWPREVKVLYLTTRTRGQQERPAWNWSATDVSTWLPVALLQVLGVSGWAPTYRVLLGGLESFFAGLQEEPGPADARGIAPVLGCVDEAALDDIAFQAGRWLPRAQQGPIKKAVLVVGADCWTSGADQEAMTVTDGHLSASHNDTMLMYKTLTENRGFLAQNIAWLRDQPNKGRVLSAIGWLMSDNVGGNELFFYFSGHGCAHPGVVLQDGAKLEVLTDDEVNGALLQRNAPGCSLWCVFDSCRSGPDPDPISDPLRDVHVLCSSPPEHAAPREVHPARCGMPQPSAPAGSAWDHPADPPFTRMTYFIWKIMEDSRWQSVPMRTLLARLRESCAASRYVRSGGCGDACFLGGSALTDSPPP